MPLPSCIVLFTRHLRTLMRWEDQHSGRKTDGKPASLALLTYAHVWSLTPVCIIPEPLLCFVTQTGFILIFSIESINEQGFYIQSLFKHFLLCIKVPKI